MWLRLFSVKKEYPLNYYKNLFCLLCSRKKVEKSSEENFKLIRNILPNKPGNSESLKSNSWTALYRSSHWRCSVRTGVLRNFTKFTGKQLCQSLFFSIKLLDFIKKETLKYVFSCEFCEFSKNNFLTEHLWTTASVSKLLCLQLARI